MASSTSKIRRRGAGAFLTAAIVALAGIASYIHLSLGGLLFTLNGLGYAGLMVLFAVGAIASHPVVARFDWFPRAALLGYAAATIVGYLIIGPYFALGWITKMVEVVLIALIVMDVRRVYGGPRAMARRAVASVVGRGAPVLHGPVGGGDLREVARSPRVSDAG